jgi:hypothetical protein
MVYWEYWFQKMVFWSKSRDHRGRNDASLIWTIASIKRPRLNKSLGTQVFRIGFTRVSRRRNGLSPQVTSLWSRVCCRIQGHSLGNIFNKKSKSGSSTISVDS